MKLDPTMRERLGTASPEELQEIAAANPEVAPLVERLLAANAAISEFLTAPGEVAEAPQPDKRRRNLRVRIWAYAAIAAGVGALLLMPGRPTADPGPPDAVAPRASSLGSSAVTIDPSPGLDVEAPGNFAVIPTRDPNITVVWLLQGDDQ